MEVLQIGLVVRGGRRRILEADGVDVGDLAGGRVGAEVAATRGGVRVDRDVGVVGSGGLEGVEVGLVGGVLAGVFGLLGRRVVVSGAALRAFLQAGEVRRAGADGIGRSLLVPTTAGSR